MSARRARVELAALLLAAACGGGSATGPQTTVTVTGTIPSFDPSKLTYALSIPAAPGQDFSGFVLTSRPVTCADVYASQVTVASAALVTFELQQQSGGTRVAATSTGAFVVGADTGPRVATVLLAQSDANCNAPVLAATAGTVNVTSWNPLRASFDVQFGTSTLQGSVETSASCTPVPPATGCR